MNRPSSTYRSTTSNATISGTFVGFAFAGKEKDLETGLSYFGARYYDADLTTGWLSVDPMADKYPSISPYAYCAWNPVKLVDPDGQKVILCGTDENKSEAFGMMKSQLRPHTKMALYMDNNGIISYSGKPKGVKEETMAACMDAQNVDIFVEIEFENTSEIEDPFAGGEFWGATIQADGIVKGNQKVYLKNAKARDEVLNDAGATIWHEIAEGLFAGYIALANKKNIGPKFVNKDNPDYDSAHRTANSIFFTNIRERTEEVSLGFQLIKKGTGEYERDE